MFTSHPFHKTTFKPITAFTPSPPLQKTTVCPPASLRGVLALCLQTDKEQRDLVFWSALRAQRLWPDSRWLMEAQRKGPLRNPKTLKERSAQKDSRLTIGWMNAKLRASDKEMWLHAPIKKLLWRPNIHVLKQIHTQAPWTPAKRNLIHATEGGRLFDSGSWGGYGVPGLTNLWWPQCWSMWMTVKFKNKNKV